MSELQPCGTRAARRRHHNRGETCNTCAPVTAAKHAPCGTQSAKRRHVRNNETCTKCPPSRKPLAPCGTYLALKRHRRKGETCETCTTDAPPKTTTPLPDLIQEITFLLNCGEGEHAILKATGYQNNPHSLRERLRHNGRADLYQRITNGWELAA